MDDTVPADLRTDSKLGAVEARVLACLVEKEVTVPDAYPLTMKALRSACNQSSNRNPVTDYDERTIDRALAELKSLGLVRFVHPSHGGRSIRYRHVTDERWQLERGPLGVLAMLILRGPETAASLRARAERHLDHDGVTIDDALDALTGGEAPQVMRLERRPGEREPRFTQLVAEASLGIVSPSDGSPGEATPTPAPEPAAVPHHDDDERDKRDELIEDLTKQLTDLRRRVDRLERLFDG